MTVPGQLEHAAMRFTIEHLQEIESRSGCFPLVNLMYLYP